MKNRATVPAALPTNLAGSLLKLVAALSHSACQLRVAFRIGDPARGLGEICDLAQRLDGLARGFEARDVSVRIGRPLERIGQGRYAVRELHNPLAGAVDGCRDPFHKPDLRGGNLTCDATILDAARRGLRRPCARAAALSNRSTRRSALFRIRVADDGRDRIRARLGFFDRRVPGIAGSLGGFLRGVRDAVPGFSDESTNVVEQSHRGLPIMPTLGANRVHAEKTRAVQ